MASAPLRSAAALLSLAFALPACGDDGGPSTGGSTQGDGPTTAPTTDEPESTTSPDGTTSSPPSTSSGPEPTTTEPPGTDDTAGDSTAGADPGGGTIDVTLDGCAIDFGGTVVVSYNGSLGVASVYDGGATLTGSFQFELTGPGTMQLSSQHRVDTGNVINMVEITAGTWTNLDADALAGGMDRIGGTLVVDAWEPAMGVADIEFQDVSLLNVVDGSVCTVNGTIVTTELYP